MFRHIVLYTYKSDISHEQIRKIYEQLDTISGKLPGRLTYTWGPYQSSEGRNQGYTHALIVDFVDEKGRDAFLHDPMRVEFSKREVLPRMVSGVHSIVSFDFEWVDKGGS